MPDTPLLHMYARRRGSSAQLMLPARECRYYAIAAPCRYDTLPPLPILIALYAAAALRQARDRYYC